jgi:hypothetical protein
MSSFSWRSILSWPEKVAPEIILEPTTEEYLEADLEDELGALSETMAFDNYRLVVQCKLRSTGRGNMWHLALFLLMGGNASLRANG